MDGMPQISRGYIRRNIYDPNDPTSNYRLYFMYNPADIQRNYVAYIEQQALDPFNTIYGSNNLIAPPGILDFSFDLFFDRQTENATGTIPRGVMTDQEYFDLVVRGLVPDGQSPALQDSGIMMINPRNITVVFGPQLSVQGRPYRASIQYQKFDHRMTPTRMTITLSMKAVYFGPQRSDFAFASSQTENTFAATIPYDESIKYNIDYDEVASVTSTEGTGTGFGDIVDQIASDPSVFFNTDKRERALAIAEELGERKYIYVWGGNDPYNPGVDCSGLVWWAYRKACGDEGAKSALGVSGRPATGSIMSGALNKGSVILGGDGAGRNVWAPMTAENLKTYARRGDLLCGPGHVAFVSENKLLGNGVRTYEAYGGNGTRTPSHLDFGWSQILYTPNFHTMLIRPF
jgi:hypothetical protein